MPFKWTGIWNIVKNQDLQDLQIIFLLENEYDFKKHD